MIVETFRVITATGQSFQIEAHTIETFADRVEFVTEDKVTLAIVYKPALVALEAAKIF